MTGLSALGWAWLSYTLLYVPSVHGTRTPPAGRLAARLGAAVAFAICAALFTSFFPSPSASLEGAFGGVLLALWAFTAAASVLPPLERLAPRAAFLSYGLAIGVGVLGVLDVA